MEQKRRERHSDNANQRTRAKRRQPRDLPSGFDGACAASASREMALMARHSSAWRHNAARALLVSLQASARVSLCEAGRAVAGLTTKSTKERQMIRGHPRLRRPQRFARGSRRMCRLRKHDRAGGSEAAMERRLRLARRSELLRIAQSRCDPRVDARTRDGVKIAGKDHWLTTVWRADPVSPEKGFNLREALMPAQADAC